LEYYIKTVTKSNSSTKIGQNTVFRDTAARYITSHVVIFIVYNVGIHNQLPAVLTTPSWA